jgi:tetratricopeptide (TPR) repeat protein
MHDDLQSSSHDDPCPDPESLAAYLNGAGPPAERERIERHMIRCADCREVASETALANSAAGEVRKVRWFPWSIAGVAAAAALLIGLQIMKNGSGARQPELQGLIAAASSQPTRPTLARLTGGFQYAPPPSANRAASGGEVPAPIRNEVARIEDAAARGDATADRAPLGIALLVGGDPDRAIATLEQAAKASPENAALHSDLAAAYLARASKTASSEDARRALELSTRAVQQDSALLEPLFNRALAYEALGASGAARQAWRDYLRADSSSQWAEEARRRAAALP